MAESAGSQTIILIAHEPRIPDLLTLLKKQRNVFEHYRLLATTEVGKAIEDELDLEVTHLFSGRTGGEIQLCGLITTNTIRAVYFIRDMHELRMDAPDIQPFYRACDLNNVPMATNMVGAVALTHWLGRRVDSPRAVTEGGVEG